MMVEEKKVRDVMTRGVISVRLDDSVAEISKILTGNSIHAVAVLDQRGDVTGVISEMDLLEVFGQDVDKLTAEDVISSHLRTITPDSNLSQAAKVMRDLAIHRLIILHPEGRRAVGILSASDIVKEMAKWKK